MASLRTIARNKQARDQEAAAQMHALAWPSYPKPKPLALDEIRKLGKKNKGGYVRAYFMNSYTGTVTAGFTSLSTHAREWRWAVPTDWGETRDRGSISRDHGHCYETLVLAAQAMRWEATEHAAAALRLADKQVQRALEGKEIDDE